MFAPPTAASPSTSRRATNVRLRDSFSEVARAQALQALGLLREAQTDPDLLDAVRAMLERIREEAISLTQDGVAVAASRAVRALGSTVAVATLEELVASCDGKTAVAPILRPIAVVAEPDGIQALRMQAQNLASAIRLVADTSALTRLAQTEKLGAAWLPTASLHALEESRHTILAGVPLYVYDDDDNLPSRLLASRLGAVGFLPAPMVLKDAVRLVRTDASRISAPPWRLVVVDRGDAGAESLASSLSCEDLLVESLRGGFRLLEALDEHVPDVIAIASNLEGVSTADLFAVLRAHSRFSSVPLLLLADPNEPVRVSPIPDAILRRNEPHLSLRRTIVELADRTSRLRALREVDPATGVLSETALLRAADHAVAQARRNPTPVTAVRLELVDHVATRRDHGAGAAERVMRTVAGVLGERLRTVDAIGRIGISGFAAVLSRCSARRAQSRMEDIETTLAGHFGQDPLVRLAIGITDTASGPDELMLRAETLMAKARHTGVTSLVG